MTFLQLLTWGALNEYADVFLHEHVLVFDQIFGLSTFTLGAFFCYFCILGDYNSFFFFGSDIAFKVIILALVTELLFEVFLVCFVGKM